MFRIRSIVLAQPGRRDELVGVLREFAAETAEMRGSNAQVLTASIGPSDSMVVMESDQASLAEFEDGLTKINNSDKMAKYGPKFAELSVPGSHRFEVYRLV